jgi:hypothetical protein
MLTHDELVKDLDSCIKGAEYGPYEWGFIALRAIAELHKPVLHSKHKYICEGCNLVYPCDTIEAIEKELQ